MVAGSPYHAAASGPGRGPYFQYCMGGGSAVGYVTVTVMVEPGVQPVVVNANRPWGNVTPGGALPAGGLAGSPVTGMNFAVAKVHVVPPPVKLAVMPPVPVGDGAEKEVTAATLMALLVPVMEAVRVSVAVRVREPTVVSVALKVPTPLVSVELAGSVAAPSVLVKCTVPA